MSVFLVLLVYHRLAFHPSIDILHVLPTATKIGSTGRGPTPRSQEPERKGRGPDGDRPTSLSLFSVGGGNRAQCMLCKTDCAFSEAEGVQFER